MLRIINLDMPFVYSASSMFEYNIEQLDLCFMIQITMMVPPPPLIVLIIQY